MTPWTRFTRWLTDPDTYRLHIFSVLALLIVASSMFPFQRMNEVYDVLGNVMAWIVAQRDYALRQLR